MSKRPALTVNEIVRVRSKTEILQTLDVNGRLEGLPFMPEMFEYCGKSFRVGKRAHKTCDFVNRTGIRRLANTVHLENIRCDGSAHGGCEAGCLIFWKEAWLERASVTNALSHERPSSSVLTTGCSELDVLSNTRKNGTTEVDPTYVCQATLLPEYTEPMSAWDVRQYIEDYRSGNVTSLVAMVGRFIYRMYDNVMNLGIGVGRPMRWLYDSFRWARGGRLYPGHVGKIATGNKTPNEVLDLQAGEIVRVKPHETILETIDERCMNRGMSFSTEMVPYCGGTYRVRNRVDRLIDERTGKMLNMKTGAVILENVTCQSKYIRGMIFCPRATFPYWRETWLDRIDQASTDRDD